MYYCSRLKNFFGKILSRTKNVLGSLRFTCSGFLKRHQGLVQHHTYQILLIMCKRSDRLAKFNTLEAKYVDFLKRKMLY